MIGGQVILYPCDCQGLGPVSTSQGLGPRFECLANASWCMRATYLILLEAIEWLTWPHQSRVSLLWVSRYERSSHYNNEFTHQPFFLIFTLWEEQMKNASSWTAEEPSGKESDFFPSYLSLWISGLRERMTLINLWCFQHDPTSLPSGGRISAPLSDWFKNPGISRSCVWKLLLPVNDIYVCQCSPPT